MSTHRHSELEPIADALGDSARLNWAELAREHPESAAVLERLHALEKLAEAHRRARDEARDAPGSPPMAFRWGPLDVHERIGEGAFGEVFRARDPVLRRDVALKLRRADAAGPASAWLEEARRLARVSHPNVIAVLGVDEHDGRAGLWTELVRGETLEARLAREGPMPAAEVAVVGVDLCRALAAVHAGGVLHGDLKLSNVMREGGEGVPHPGRVVLMDFGSGQDGPPASPTTWTPLSAAPEVLRGGPVYARSDQYALGALLYRLLTGRHPIEAGSLAELIERAGSRTPPLRDLRPDLPPALHDAVLRALAPEPEARHANLAAFERALSAAIGARDDQVRSRHIVALIAAALVLGVAATLVFVRVRPAPPTAPAAGTAATPVPSAPAPTALSASATLLRRTPSGSEALVDGGAVRAGDRLVLQFRSPEPVWLYVFNEDAGGAASALFPLPRLATTNPLAAGREHQLPGMLDGRAFAWQVGEGSGGETFLVIAGRQAVPAAEALAARLSPASPASRGATRAERGVETLVEEPSPGEAAGALVKLEQQLTQAGSGVWVWRLRAIHDRP